MQQTTVAGGSLLGKEPPRYWDPIRWRCLCNVLCCLLWLPVHVLLVVDVGKSDFVEELLAEVGLLILPCWWCVVLSSGARYFRSNVPPVEPTFPCRVPLLEFDLSTLSLHGYGHRICIAVLPYKKCYLSSSRYINILICFI